MRRFHLLNSGGATLPIVPPVAGGLSSFRWKSPLFPFHLCCFVFLRTYHCIAGLLCFLFFCFVVFLPILAAGDGGAYRERL